MQRDLEHSPTTPCGGGVGDVLRPLLGVWGKPPGLLAVLRSPPPIVQNAEKLP
jgi:hypothetical protein